jgi:hypothetical protein
MRPAEIADNTESDVNVRHPAACWGAGTRFASRRSIRVDVAGAEAKEPTEPRARGMPEAITLGGIIDPVLFSS